MSAAQLLRAGSAGLRSVRSTSLSSSSAQHFRLLHTTSPLLRREASLSGSRLSARSVASRNGGGSMNASSTSDPVANTSAPEFPLRTTASSSAGIPRHHQAKVEVLPFRIPTKAAKDFLITLATTEVMPRLMSKWDIFKHQVLSLIGLHSMSNNDRKIVKLEHMTALYLPTWIVDASFEIKCRGNDGRAEANFIVTSSRFPGHSWKPMDSLPMLPPPPHDMIPVQGLQKVPNYAADTPKADWDNLAMVDYESYESHLKHNKESKVKIKGGIPDPIPFTISPLFLPDMLRRKLELKDLTFAPDFESGINLPGGDKHGLGLTIALVDQDGEQLRSSPVRFEPNTFKLDMVAAYPILMPLHMAEFSYVEEEGEKHYITMVLGAWDTNELQFCMKEKGEDWQWSFGEASPLKVDFLDLFPRAPIKTSINKHFEQEREKERAMKRKRLAEEAAEEGEPKKGRKTQAELSEEWAKRNEEHQKAFRADLNSRMLEKTSIEKPIKAAVEGRSLDMLKKADWIHWERDEREAYQLRISPEEPCTSDMSESEKERFERSKASVRTSPVEPHPFSWLRAEQDRKLEREHPDRKNGLGRYINWSSPFVQRLSHNVYANRRYLTEAIPEVLLSRRRMVCIEEGGHDVDNSLIKAKLKDGTKLSGEDAYKTIVGMDLHVRQQRETLKPRWLKNLEEAAKRT
ncbi:hypothetical protein NDA13_003552 [Ustilago tritici]|nr:hypothetical protein NDA13_003552 [Ustilago tritici]